MCIDRFDEFYLSVLASVKIENIFIFAAGESGSSAEYWRHKFVRGLEGGKENSRTQTTLNNKKEQVFWDDKVILLVDDIIGTGEQFSDFVNTIILRSDKIQERFSNSRIIYFTPVATEFGTKDILNFIGEKVELHSGIVLKKLFSENNDIWNKSTILPRDKIEKICQKYAKKLNINSRDLLGYKDSQLLVAFQDHTPDNTIPLLWYKNGSIEWENLLRR